MLEFYADKTAQFINMLWHWMSYKLLMVSVLAKINPVPCLCTSTLGQRVYNWLHCLVYRKDNLWI